ncbi:hypothetical protein GCM10007049_33760 [Echinicola pacifica]|uniref:DUF2911 domain-containing protein n=1 Tax=Echinicola pacifica TaxID=346377 RepID=A0A918QB42_9BACT|nr:DUF2911 domain-containing protein [Echinicola pacifica]GGZ37767.1 hypothetical protein GCM10007049_33760 [Echinicola pacifica]
MKKVDTLFLAWLVSLVLVVSGCAGENKASEEAEREETEAMEMKEEERASPMKSSEAKINGKGIFIQYGAPSVKGRTIWGNLEAYGEVWRTGANEATYVSFEQDVMVEGKSVPAGKYSLFTIPAEKGPWTVILNKDWDLEHGHFQYNEKNDVIRVQVQPEWKEDIQEQLKITVTEPGIVVRWEKLNLPIKVE